MTFLSSVFEEKKAIIKTLLKSYKEEEDALPLFTGSAYKYLKGRLLDEGFLVFAEVKRMSPSKGVLNSNLDAKKAAQSYVKSGAAVVSVLTDEKYFGGSLKDLSAVAEAVSVPVLMKDFVVDLFQIMLAKKFGASLILLLSELLQDELPTFINEARKSGIEPLVEVGRLKDIHFAVQSDAKIIGINSRDLHSLKIDLNVFEEASEFVRKAKEDNPDLIFIAESGITREEEVVQIKKLGFDGVLIGSRLSMEGGAEFISSVKDALLKLKEKL